jgi:hypothetical protein
MDTKFYTIGGLLTPYALACGYVQRVDSDKYSIVLGRHGGGQKFQPYFVEVIKIDKTYESPNERYAFHDQFDRIDVARKTWKRLCQTYFAD